MSTVASREKDYRWLCRVYQIPASQCSNADYVTEFLKAGFADQTLDPAPFLDLADRYGIQHKRLGTAVTKLIDVLVSDDEAMEEKDQEQTRVLRPWEQYPVKSPYTPIDARSTKIALDWTDEVLDEFCKTSYIQLDDPGFLQQTRKALATRMHQYIDQYHPPRQHFQVLALAALYVTGSVQGLDEYCANWADSPDAWVDWCASGCPKPLFLAYVKDLVGTTV